MCEAVTLYQQGIGHFAGASVSDTFSRDKQGVTALFPGFVDKCGSVDGRGFPVGMMLMPSSPPIPGMGFTQSPKAETSSFASGAGSEAGFDWLLHDAIAPRHAQNAKIEIVFMM